MDDAARRTKNLAAAAEELVDLFLDGPSDEAGRRARIIVAWSIIERVRRKVDALQDAPAPSAAPTAPPADGPMRPSFFCYEGKRYDLAPNAWRIVSYLWTKPERSAMETDLIEHLWGHDDAVGHAAVKSAVSRARNELLEQGCPLDVRRKGGYVYLSDAR